MFSLLDATAAAATIDTMLDISSSVQGWNKACRLTVIEGCLHGGRGEGWSTHTEQPGSFLSGRERRQWSSSSPRLSPELSSPLAGCLRVSFFRSTPALQPLEEREEARSD
ncbi:Os07g0514101 [Oryza sativa Japonica Group]|uniref:Os07g0514101 protein n=1 Tax=Oryza sativa subsp. japonica TaxID=39947 RepID=A0A0P0X6I0_ORYSJ|nr:Os07g0514101 [Oryza sativa Japonica Group]